ncbi:hypothetical protein EDD16DRAFT_523337 [Pisolithus croceorrhizus]|nr:hypothetical protein EDD16DRAFT_523337 [Pisolithus croceorrhizus]KAI6160431.1 hypothetical protein EDD17DRAFT_807385 [Pisolithus thermaeus]
MHRFLGSGFHFCLFAAHTCTLLFSTGFSYPFAFFCMYFHYCPVFLFPGGTRDGSFEVGRRSEWKSSTAAVYDTTVPHRGLPVTHLDDLIPFDEYQISLLSHDRFVCACVRSACLYPIAHSTSMLSFNTYASFWSVFSLERWRRAIVVLYACGHVGRKRPKLIHTLTPCSGIPVRHSPGDLNPSVLNGTYCRPTYTSPADPYRHDVTFTCGSLENFTVTASKLFGCQNQPSFRLSRYLSSTF